MDGRIRVDRDACKRLGRVCAPPKRLGRRGGASNGDGSCCEHKILQSSAYLQKRCPRRASSLSRSSSTRLLLWAAGSAISQTQCRGRRRRGSRAHLRLSGKSAVVTEHINLEEAVFVRVHAF